MLLYVHQLVSNFVCCVFGAWQVMHSGFIKAFTPKQLHFAFGNNADESSETKATTIKNQKHGLEDE